MIIHEPKTRKTCFHFSIKCLNRALDYGAVLVARSTSQHIMVAAAKSCAILDLVDSNPVGILVIRDLGANHNSVGDLEVYKTMDPLRQCNRRI